VLLLLATAGGAQGQEIEAFERAREAYDNQQYEKAAERFEELVGGEVPRLRNEPLVLESRKYLAASYLFLGRREQAKKQFELLLEREPDYQLDPVSFPSEVHQVFGKVRQRVQQERERRQAEQRRQQQQRRQREAQELLEAQERAQRLRDLAETVVVERDNSRVLAMVPFGVGQYQNGHEQLGLTLAITEGVLVATSVTTFALHTALASDARQPVRMDESTLEPNRRLRAYRWTNWISTGLFAAVAVAGVLDAQLRFKPEIRSTRKRELPEDLRPEDESSGGAGPGAREGTTSAPDGIVFGLGPTGFELRF
jgi:tetratricopeptide (TPR) repeat protein